jgi:hypothetical protein
MMRSILHRECIWLLARMILDPSTEGFYTSVNFLEDLVEDIAFCAHTGTLPMSITYSTYQRWGILCHKYA